MSTTVESGAGEAAEFVSAVRAELTEALAFRPYPGTLNVGPDPGIDELESETLRGGNLSNEHCDGVVVSPCRLGGVRGAVLRPLVAEYPDGKVEVLAPVHLRELFGFSDGDPVTVSAPAEAYRPGGPTADAAGLDAFGAVVFDLDGTLVDLDVDWSTVHAGIERMLGDAIDGTLRGYTRPEIMDLAREVGRYDDLAALLTEHEREGAETAPSLPLLAVLPELDCPVAVCTANAGAAAERSLERFGMREHVDAIVARETVREGKPHPQPLRESLDRLDTPAGNAVFVGDERSDAETAVAAGTSFLHPGQLTVR